MVEERSPKRLMIILGVFYFVIFDVILFRSLPKKEKQFFFFLKKKEKKSNFFFFPTLFLVLFRAVLFLLEDDSIESGREIADTEDAENDPDSIRLPPGQHRMILRDIFFFLNLNLK